MKKLPIFLSMLIFCLASCQEEEPVTNLQKPKWLEQRIHDDENYANQNPKSMVAWGVWTRTEWSGNIYFEYSNGLSSSMYSPISFEGDTLPFLIVNSSTDYFNQKCCSDVVWHGSQIDEEYLKLFHGI
jgi:hypothetical protein